LSPQMELLCLIVFAAISHRTEFRISLWPDGVRTFCGALQHSDRWLVTMQQVRRIDCDQNPRNPSIAI
jgi:hypothetical protein